MSVCARVFGERDGGVGGEGVSTTRIGPTPSLIQYYLFAIEQLLFSMAEVQLAPLRSLRDFLLESARFQIPQVKDPEKWANRVLHNLLYYQTNYFLSALVIFLTIG